MIAAKNAGFLNVIVPEANTAEAALIAGLDIYAVPALADAVALVLVLGHGAKIRCVSSPTSPPFPGAVPAGRDFGDVRGQRTAKRALEIASAGGHNAVLVGPPRCGKTMLARRALSSSSVKPQSADLSDDRRIAVVECEIAIDGLRAFHKKSDGGESGSGRRV